MQWHFSSAIEMLQQSGFKCTHTLVFYAHISHTNEYIISIRRYTQLLLSLISSNIQLHENDTHTHTHQLAILFHKFIYEWYSQKLFMCVCVCENCDAQKMMKRATMLCWWQEMKLWSFNPIVFICMIIPVLLLPIRPPLLLSHILCCVQKFSGVKTKHVQRPFV